MILNAAARVVRSDVKFLNILFNILVEYSISYGVRTLACAHDKYSIRNIYQRNLIVEIVDLS